MQLKVTEALEQGFEQGVSDMVRFLNELFLTYFVFGFICHLP